jgi:hypothetical protein
MMFWPQVLTQLLKLVERSSPPSEKKSHRIRAVLTALPRPSLTRQSVSNAHQRAGHRSTRGAKGHDSLPGAL